MVENCNDEFLKFDLEYDQVSRSPLVLHLPSPSIRTSDTTIYHCHELGQFS
jgi:hypothetical protein